jgi:hypothetical protein
MKKKNNEKRNVATKRVHVQVKDLPARGPGAAKVRGGGNIKPNQPDRNIIPCI